MNTSVFSNPEKVGPGIWFTIHINAINANTNQLKDLYIIYINNICDNFKCKKCQSDFRKFIDINPFKNYWYIYDNKNNDIGFFKWSWELHNFVNNKLKKYQPTFDEAYRFYSDVDVGACFNCNSSPIQSINLSDQVSRGIPNILTLYRESGDIKPKPFKLKSANS